MDRIIITGWPRSGKSTLAKKIGEDFGIEPKSTDSLIHELSWTEVSSMVAEWFDLPGPWIIEGVAVMRALRKWHWRYGPDVPPPCDFLYIIDRPLGVELKPGQISMGKGIDTVFAEIEQWLGATVYRKEWPCLTNT